MMGICIPKLVFDVVLFGGLGVFVVAAFVTNVVCWLRSPRRSR